MTFEEEFPKIDPPKHACKYGGAWNVVLSDQVRDYCLDKERVREIINRLSLQAKSSAPDQQIELCLARLLDQLGLER